MRAGFGQTHPEEMVDSGPAFEGRGAVHERYGLLEGLTTGTSAVPSGLISVVALSRR